MKRLVCFIILVFSIVHTYADNTMLVVLQSNGNTMSYVLSSKPIITVSDSVLKITTSTNTSSLEIHVKEIDKFFFSEAPSSVDKVRDKEIRFIRTSDDELKIIGLEGTKTNIFVCDMNGKQSKVNCTPIDSGIKLLFSSCPSGVYIVKINNLESFKFIKK